MARNVELTENSLAAWRSINEDGRLSRARLDVYNCIATNGPLTQNKIDRLLHSTSAHKRVSELVERGVVKGVGDTVDPATNETNTLWDVTENLPVEPTTHVSSPTPIVSGDAKALQEIEAAIPKVRQSAELRSLIQRVRDSFGKQLRFGGW
jgi:DNA-binding Lrp family transcriptional regulator